MLRKSTFVLFLLLPPLLIAACWALKFFSPGWTQQFGGFGNVANALAVFLTYYYVVLTGYYVFLTGRLVQQAILSQGHVLRAQEAEFRPYVIADIEFEGILGSLVIKNVGRLPAQNVRIKFDPEIIATSRMDGTVYNLTEQLLSEPIAFFPPGKVQRSNLGPAEEFLDPDEPWVFNVPFHTHGPVKSEKLPRAI